MSNGSGYVTVKVSDGTEMNAYVAHPSGAGPHPAIMVFQDGFGVNASSRPAADRYAGQGFVAIAPELFHRTAVGFEGSYDDFDTVMPHIRALTTEGLIADVTASFEWLRAQRDVNATQIAAVGFCMGGRTAYLANSALPLAASISYYGGSIAPGLLDRAPQLHGPQLFFWGGQDKGIPPEQRRAVADAVSAAGKQFVNVVFSNANHGFFTAHRHEPAAARESWALSMAFLGDALGLGG
ncbi:MAG TPA: dienelactone hydrolase family protein [Gemmatimonadaceae bacterium]|nr:dienelactone hydrolase family protein [Gemmatimonadaceae bacterium]